MESCCARASAPMRKRGAERKGDREALIAPALELKREADRENHRIRVPPFLFATIPLLSFALLAVACCIEVTGRLPISIRSVQGTMH